MNEHIYIYIYIGDKNISVKTTPIVKSEKSDLFIEAKAVLL